MQPLSTFSRRHLLLTGALLASGLTSMPATAQGWDEPLSRPGYESLRVIGETTRSHDASDPTEVTFRRDEALHLGRDGATLWARGATYKASLDESGFTYIPFFGSRASRNWPITFQLTTARASGEPLDLAAAPASFDGEAAVLPRGSVEARYHLSENAVEQTFVVANDAAAGGDLELEVTVATDLAVARDGQALVFTGPDGSVRFGAATVLDGAGHAESIATEWDGQSITFRVPAAFVAEAVGPIVVDPVITTTVVDGYFEDLTRPDVAYDADENTFTVVYEEAFSAADGDLYYRTLDGDTLAVVDQGYVELSSGRSYGPHLATIAATNRFIVVYTLDDPFGLPEIHTRSRLAAPGSSWEVDYVVAAPTEFFTYENPDVGGEAFEGAGSTNAAVVFEVRARGAGTFAAGIGARLIGSDGVPAPSVINIVSALGPLSMSQPVISKFTGDPVTHGAWWVAYLAGPAGAPASEVRTTRMRYDGTFTELNAQTWAPTSSPIIHRLEVSSPHIGALTETLHVTFDTTISGTTRTLVLTRARMGLGPQVSAWPIEQKDVARSTPKQRGAFATLQDRALFTYFDESHVTGRQEIRSSTFELPTDLSAGIGERRIPVGTLTQSTPAATTSAASKASGGTNNSSQQVFVVWQDEGTPGGDSDIFGALVDLPAPRVAASTFCRSGPNSTGDYAFLAAYGDNGLTSPKSMVVTGLPPFTVGYFLTSRTVATSYPPGTQGILCLGGSIGRYAGNVLSAGSNGRFDFTVNPTSLAAPGGSVAAMVGQRYSFQAWYRDANPSVTSNFSNAVTIRF